MFSLLSFLLIGHLSLITNANRLRHSLVNKQFIDQLAEGSYEIIHPFQLRDGERMGIDTREYFLNTTTIQHSRQVRFVLRSSVLLHQRLRISLNLNEHLLNEKSQEIIFNKSTHFTLEDSEQNNIESIKLENIENCYYQGSVIGEPGSMVTLSTCDGLWGLLAFANGSALGIWPLEGGDKGKRRPHVLFRALGNKIKYCPTNSNSNFSQCSVHGNCTSTGNCLCFDGRNGKACDVRSPIRKTEKSPSLEIRKTEKSPSLEISKTEMSPALEIRKTEMSPSLEIRKTEKSPSLEFSSFRDISTRFVGVSNGKVVLETATLLIILLFVGLLLLLILLFLLLFYRRSTADPFQHANVQFKQTTIAGNEGEEEDDNIKEENEKEENNTRTIKFGQMPSWREEKRKRKTNKRVYDALQRITEANEMDSLSLKSRESSTTMNNTIIPQQQQQQTCLNINPLISEYYPNNSGRTSVCSQSQSLQHSQLQLNYQQNNTGIFFSKREGGINIANTSLPLSEGGDVEEEALLFNSPFGPRLANISLLLRKLEETTTEEDRSLTTNNWSVPPPASADSGNPGSNLELRESPSLFSDPYRLDLPG